MLNNVSIVGRLVRDPSLGGTDNARIARFTLAVDRDYVGTDGKRQADFIPCIAWRQKAEFANKHLTKGQLVGVVGRVVTSNYTAKDGTGRTSVEISVDDFYFLSPRGEQNAASTEAATTTATTDTTTYDNTDTDFAVDSDLPF